MRGRFLEEQTEYIAKNKANIKRNAGRLEMADAKSNQAPARETPQRSVSLARRSEPLCCALYNDEWLPATVRAWRKSSNPTNVQKKVINRIG